MIFNDLNPPRRNMLLFFFLNFFLSGFSPSFAQAQELSLKQCFAIAEQHNITLKQMRQSIETRRHKYRASQLARLPKINLLGGFTYLSDPLAINLQTARNSVVEGTAQQNTATANSIYHQITGNDLPESVQHTIYQGAKDIIEEVYPKNNPKLSRQHYFTAGVEMHLPLYLGGKLKTAAQISRNRLETGKLNEAMTQHIVALSISSQYFKVLYLNSLLQKQRQLVKVYEKTVKKANALVEAEFLPPYQGHWAKIALSQAKTSLSTFALEKENALLTLGKILGVAQKLRLSDTLTTLNFPAPFSKELVIENNPSYQWLKGKTEIARSVKKLRQSAYLPNIFGVANYQFLRKDLPVINPPWMVGLTFQWNLFSSFQNHKRVKAARSLVKENKLLVKNKAAKLHLKTKVTHNKLLAFKAQMHTLNKARKEAAHTVSMIRKRMENKLSSPKDVDQALKVQLSAEKAYYTAVFSYDLAVARYLNILGKPKTIVDYFN